MILNVAAIRMINIETCRLKKSNIPINSEYFENWSDYT